MDNPQAIRFVNQRARVRAEDLRRLYYLLSDDLAQWNSGINLEIANNSEVDIEDGRANEGVSRLTGEDVHTLMARLLAVLNVLDAAYAMDVVTKACVRELDIVG